MPHRLPTHFCVTVVFGLMSAALLALTIVVPKWIELWFGLAPDAGDDSSEWEFAISLTILSVLMFGFAGRTWRKRAWANASTLAIAEMTPE